jgi:hypothetical protein
VLWGVLAMHDTHTAPAPSLPAVASFRGHPQCKERRRLLFGTSQRKCVPC